MSTSNKAPLNMKKKKRYYYSLKNFRIVPKRKIDGRWTLIRQLGSGGNGEVWRCRDIDGEEYAIKFLKTALYEPYTRFYDEVVFMESFGSIPGVLPIIAKHIPPVKERFENIKAPFYYVMPLAEAIGKTVSGESVENRIQIIKALLKMLVNLHSQGIAHRDIKPSNILLYEGNYVLSDFGLVYFYGKSSNTPPHIPMGAKWTRSPQMERNALTADKFKSDVYSMAKTIWMLFTGDLTSFEGQYDPSVPILSLRRYLPGMYLTPLDSLLSQCTNHEEDKRPTAEEMLNLFNDWDNINHNWDRENLMQWVEVQRKLFPYFEPDQCEWTNPDRIIGVLNILGSYHNLNHMFFPNGGGLDLTRASLAIEPGCIELDCDGLVFIVRPLRLCFERICDDFQWNYFRLELGKLNCISKDYKTDEYLEEFGQLRSNQGVVTNISVQEYDEMSSEEKRRTNARHIGRYLHGSFVIFHKDSIYNNLISKYEGEHDRVSAEQFRGLILSLSQKLAGKTMEDFRKRETVNGES
jgi:serine/threonine-protein kinase